MFNFYKMLNLRILGLLYNVIFEQMFIRSVDDLRLFMGRRKRPAVRCVPMCFSRLIRCHASKALLWQSKPETL
jgi:hypothetical protein